VFDLPRAPEKSDEPWWSYHEAQGRKADALLAQLYAPFDEAAR